MYDVIVKKFAFAISSLDEFLILDAFHKGEQNFLKILRRDINVTAQDIVQGILSQEIVSFLSTAASTKLVLASGVPRISFCGYKIHGHSL